MSLLSSKPIHPIESTSHTYYGINHRAYIATEILSSIVSKSAGVLSVDIIEQQVDQAVFYADKLLDRLSKT